MARFQMELPNDLIKEFEKLEKNTEQMMGEMTKAGAEVVMANVKKNIPSSFLDSDIMNCLKLTRVYKTPSDDGINTKIGFYGYFKYTYFFCFFKNRNDFNDILRDIFNFFSDSWIQRNWTFL